MWARAQGTHPPARFPDARRGRHCQRSENDVAKQEPIAMSPAFLAKTNPADSPVKQPRCGFTSAREAILAASDNGLLTDAPRRDGKPRNDSRTWMISFHRSPSRESLERKLKI